MLADLAILSQDIFTVPRDVLPATVSTMTIVGGALCTSVSLLPIDDRRSRVAER